MQSNQNGNMDNGDKSLSEWPKLGDVSSNVKLPAQNGGSMKHSRVDPKRANTPTDSDDSAKENDESMQQMNSHGVRKKGSRQKWVPVPIVPIPYRKRYERGGRPPYESTRGAASSNSGNDDTRNENSENLNGNDGGRRGGNSRFRGKRGRGFSHNWKRREETSRGEVENPSEPNDNPADAENLQSAMYYDPYLHSHYAAVTRRNELKKAIRNQIEYYFSDENLVKDFFMRRRMDALGYVPLTLVAGFHRVKNLTTDYSLIVESVNESDKLDILHNVKLRPVVDPLKWPIQDFNGLRPDVPDFIPGQPYFSVSSFVECMQNLNLYSPDSACPENEAEVIEGPTEIHFEGVTQNLAVSAT